MIRGLIFDINGTVIDILTNEYHDDAYRTLGNLLDYQGITLAPDEFRTLYFELNKQQRRDSREQFPEFDAIGVFQEIIERYASDYTLMMPPEKLAALPVFLAEAFRAATRFQLQLYPDVAEVLTKLRETYRMAAVSDGQSVWAIPELRAVGLDNCFDPVIVSSDLGYRKPDERIFEAVLDRMQLAPSEALFIGNDMYRDVYGANRLGIPTVFFKSNQGEQKYAGAEPDYIIYHFSELPEAIRFLTKKIGTR